MYHTTKEGKSMFISMMENDHLLNTINLLVERATNAYKILKNATVNDSI